MSSLKSSRVLVTALAFTLMLGVLAPATTFALEGGLDGNAVEVEEDSAETKDVKEYSVAESVVELFRRINEEDGFEGYREALGLVSSAEVVRLFITPFKDLPEDYALEFEGFGEISEEQWAVLGEMTIMDFLEELGKSLGVEESPEFQEILDEMQAEYDTQLEALRSQVKEMIKPEQDVDEASAEELLALAETLPDYDKYAKLYIATAFIRDIDGLAEQGVLTTEMIEAAYAGKEATLLKEYQAMATAAVAIDPEAAEGLVDYKPAEQLPETGTGTTTGGTTVTGTPADAEKPKTPATGVARLVEVGALDTEAVLLIGATAVAIVVGAGVVARLYLHRKF